MRIQLIAASLLTSLMCGFAADDYATSTAAPELSPPQPGAPYIELGPMLGHISAQDARIWIKATGPAKLTVRVGETADLRDAREIDGPALVESGAFTGHVLVPELKAASRYYYAVLLDGSPANARPWPSFVTAPERETRGRLRFAFGSCAGKEGWLDAATWADLEARTTIDLVLLLGDNHYANTPDPAKQRAAFAAHRRNPGFVALTRRTPLYGIWDDHDFGPNNSDGTLAGKELGLATFKEFFPNPGYGEPENPGVYFTFSRGDVDFFMLDVRYHRSPNNALDDGTKTMLGATQLAWLKRELLASKATVKFIGSGSEWQSHSQADCWITFDRERKEILDFLDEHGMNNVVLLSGDRHFTAGYQVRGQTIEITSGPLGSPNSKVSKPTPEMFTVHDRGKLYCVFDVDTVLPKPQLTLEIYETGAGLVEKRPFTWEEVTGETKIAPLKIRGAAGTKVSNPKP